MAFTHNVGGGDFAVKSEINVTPLVDVCLVLLIIFMVVTPMLQAGVDVALPETLDPPKMPEGGKQLNIAIKSDGQVYVGQQWVPTESLLAGAVWPREGLLASLVGVAAMLIAAVTVVVQLKDALNLVCGAEITRAYAERRS